MMTNFDQISALTALLTDDELEALAFKCESLIKDRERIKREELQQELMGNLQEAISDILHNGFELTIKNTERDCCDDYDEVYFEPNDIYSITIE